MFSGAEHYVDDSWTKHPCRDDWTINPDSFTVNKAGNINFLLTIEEIEDEGESSDDDKEDDDDDDEK